MGQSYNVDTEARILECASRMFMTQGYKATSTRAIAQEIGMTQPNLYHYYKNKESLYQGVMAYQLDLLNQELQVILDCYQGDMTKSLYDLSLTLLTYQSMDYMMMQHDMTHMVSDEIRQSLRQLWQEKMLAPICQLFAKADEVIRPDFTAEELGSLYLSLMFAAMKVYPHLSATQLAKKFVTIFLQGVVA
ncbi:TetR/AcrR family transcriptional regulator [Aerococcus kribbianus]|uniref:TetR/AcrR family transcriptional regulator n=1 Tax=Aerococcus kribbianus TaxID=2999064 RepID=A0A9X3JEV8_9LACT|nr:MULTISPECIES: TetR/AcrR family transcriptional regulator [unclassified Aerococcus]MCZ0717544.1 TetR/AcrR family transcriptional regulator [Aerococcus sp. YH-aer221]MCZ0725832.1 TetR/AcrR family transcriptional regulator [Aerococcus sp. YH-aer222]